MKETVGCWGCFERLHLGHLYALKQIKSCGEVSVFLVDDEVN